MPAGALSGTIYVVDAHSLIFQVFHAIRGMTSPAGLPTNAVFGFLRDLLFLRSLQPDYLVCAFDRDEPTFRSSLYAPYKANRPPIPDDLQMQLPLIHQGLAALSVPVVSKAGFEADDLLATIARVAAEGGLSVFLCTSDKDCRQLIRDQVRIYSLRTRQVFGRPELLEDWGITPEQVVDLQALVGDSVDNVPGVPGIGIKTAAKLLQEFGTLDNLLANLDRVPGKKRQSLRDSKELLQISRSLVRLNDAVELDFDWDSWRLQPIDTPRLLALCREWGFHSLANQVRTLGGKQAAVAVQGELFAEPPSAASAAEEEAFPFGANVPSTSAIPENAAPWQAEYLLIDTPERFEQIRAELSRQSRFAIDLETTSLNPLDARIVGIALCWQAGRAYYLPLRGPSNCPVLDPVMVLSELAPLLADPSRAKVNQNIKYDLLVLRANGIALQGIAGDPMIADYLLHAGERNHNLEELARRYLNHQVIPITDLIGVKNRKQPQKRMDEVPTAQVAEYAGEDADVAWRLSELLEAQLSADPGGRLRTLYEELEIPLLEVLAEMEYHGVRVEVSVLRQLSQEMAGQLAALEKDIYEIAGHPFNIASLPQLRQVLFEELKLPVQGKTGVTGLPSTDQETLEKLAALDHPGARLPRKILEHRQISKLKGTYVDALPLLIQPRTGRIHTSFNQTVTATGRLSSTEPNLQNIPVRRELGQQIRQAFVPEPGWVLLTADYSQIELRLLAHFCEDETLCRAFAEKRDIHTAVAAQIFHVAESEVTPAQRRMAKTVNFGVIYGISAGGLAQRLQISKSEAADFIKAYFERYPRVEAYQKRLLEECRHTGQVTTLLGRRRQFDRQAIRAHTSYQDRNAAEREAINMEVQGSAADLIKLAMLQVHRRLRAEGMKARLLLQIHDELVLEMPPEELHRVAGLIQYEMTAPVAERLRLRVPLQVDVAAGPNWLDTEALTPGVAG